MPDALGSYRERGWAIFEPDDRTLQWAQACAPLAERLMRDPAQDHWYRCARTWFAGVNALPNEADGSVPGEVPAITGDAIDFIRGALGHHMISFDRAQISVTFPGYPQHGAEDTKASHRFRVMRYAAHIDGLERLGETRRRRLNETHSFLLGIPLAAHPLGASPFVIWHGSHEIMREALRSALADTAPERWFDLDITEAYTAARKRCFDEHSLRISV